MKTFFNRQKIFLLFFSLIYFSLSLPAGYAGFNIDASWHEGLVMAIDKGFIFGQDFIFNYGSLGYLNTGLLPKSVSIWVLVAAEMLTLLNYLIIISLCFQKAERNWWIVAISALLIFMPWGFISDTSFTFFYFFLFWLLYAKQTKNSAALLLAIIFSVLIFYIKVNLSIVVYILFYASLIYFWLAKFFTLRTVVICFILQFLLTYSLSSLLNVDIIAYLEASMKIIDAYQDAMAAMILSTNELLTLLIFEVLILLVVVLFIFKTISSIIKNNFQGVYLYLLVALAWFLCFKQAHTAVAPFNIFGFFLFMPPLAALIYLFTEDTYKLWAGQMFITILLLHLAATQLIRFYIGQNTFKGYLLTFPPTNISQRLESEPFTISHVKDVLEEKNPYNYFRRLATYNYEDNFKPNPVNLSANLLKRIGKASVDIVPHQISHIYFNQLNYNPRPVIQSYQANSDWLMKKNGDKYLSKTAPKFVLFRLEAFREQNPFWVETHLSEALLRNYTLVDSTVIEKDTFSVFQRNNTVKGLIISNIKNVKFKLNQDIEIPNSDNPIRFSAKIAYSLKGKLARLYFQPPYLYCSVTYQNGKQESFRVIDKILRGGVFINQKVSNHADVSNFFQNKGVDNQRVIKIRFWAKYNWGFEENFEGQFNEIKIKE
ncbi:hypothetical protein EMA8858_02506 [Emticicia aquatica]|uniref:Transmembrane protein n=1 Tax=Emticicia aquatica TaxID=1681835 RepID=A0ABM9AS78_9BACT|nr:hypothetical protein [Emticicia aquatica]CAH0996374.1 hypothetical protein EMA8858_02506 [Emticicia aquatica]